MGQGRQTLRAEGKTKVQEAASAGPPRLIVPTSAHTGCGLDLTHMLQFAYPCSGRVRHTMHTCMHACIHKMSDYWHATKKIHIHMYIYRNRDKEWW